MPKQSRRIAARQAQLAGRSKKKARPRPPRPTPPPATPPPAETPVAETPQPRPTPRPVGPSPRLAQASRQVRAELVRIGLVTGLLLVLLGVAVVVLR